MTNQARGRVPIWALVLLAVASLTVLAGTITWALQGDDPPAPSSASPSPAGTSLDLPQTILALERLIPTNYGSLEAWCAATAKAEALNREDTLTEDLDANTKQAWDLLREEQCPHDVDYMVEIVGEVIVDGYGSYEQFCAEVEGVELLRSFTSVSIIKAYSQVLEEEC